MTVLSPMGDKLPTSESQTRPLTQLKPDEEYCRVEWDFSRSHAYRLMDSVKVLINVPDRGQNVPDNLEQTRPLTKLPPDQQAEVWQEAGKTPYCGEI